ncbi:hypothetical protein D3C71_981300 [compost metagenome]
MLVAVDHQQVVGVGCIQRLQRLRHRYRQGHHLLVARRYLVDHRIGLRVAPGHQQVGAVRGPVGGLAGLRAQALDRAQRFGAGQVGPPQAVVAGAIRSEHQLPAVGGKHGLAIAAIGGEQALGRARPAALERHPEQAELGLAVHEGEHLAVARHRRRLRIVDADIAQGTGLHIQLVQPRFAVHAAAEHDVAAVAAPRPAPDLGRIIGKLLGHPAGRRQAPQVADLRIAHEHDPAAIRRVARGIVEAVLGHLVVQR